MSGLSTFFNGYNDFLEKHRDPRTADWFLSGKLGHLLVILVTYVYFCTKAGPRYMKDRKPYDLKGVIQIYNIFQILASSYLVYLGFVAGWATEYSYTCQPVVPGDKGLMMARGVWMYFTLKLIELLDTVFFVLRKKNNQVSYLHLYHHTLMPVCAWVGLTFVPGGHGTLLGLINSFIHIIMYVYYFLSSFGPKFQKFLWWKKHLTAMQMIQFCVIFHHNFQVLFRECSYPKTLNFLLATQAAYFLYLFGVFYYKQYVKSSKVKKNFEKSIERNEESSKNSGNSKNGFLLNGKNPTGTANQKVSNGIARKQKAN